MTTLLLIIAAIILPAMMVILILSMNEFEKKTKALGEFMVKRYTIVPKQIEKQIEENTGIHSEGNKIVSTIKIPNANG